MTDIPSDALEHERLVIDAAVWRGIRNAIVPCALFWAAFAALGWYLASL